MIQLDITKQLQAAEGTMQLQVQCSIEAGQFVTLYGISGAGKTSTLRMLAGLMQPDAGQIIVEGKTWFDANTPVRIPPQARGIAY